MKLNEKKLKLLDTILRAVIAGSLLPRETAQTERNHNGNMLFNAWQLIIRLVAPFLLALLFLYNL